MIVTFRSDAGPIEGFERATFRVAVNDEGIGEIVGPPDVIDAIAGRVVCEVDGTAVFAWEPEDRRQEARDTEQVTLSGRGGSAVLERIIVLPVGYPNFTERTRTETGAPFAVFADLLAEAQGRGRGTALTPTWTATEDSNGQPWTETISVQLDPGTTLRTLIEQFAEVEGAEWIVRPNGNIDAAAQLGNDVADEVVLFYGRDQVSRGRTSSTREQRQAIFIEASTGVSEASNSAGASAGEIWLEAQDYADVLSRDALASKLAERLSDPQEEAEIAIVPEAGAFTKFAPGDIIGLDTGSGAPQRTRLVALTVEVEDGVDVTVEGTLITEVALRQKRIDRAIEAKADVQLAATPVIQRRHGLVTADKFLSGAVGEDVAIASENYVPGVDGWAILGNGNAEFNDAVFRGDLQSDNYDPGVAGWALDRDGNAEFNDATFRGDLQSDNYNPGVAGWFLDRNGFAEFEEGLFRGDIVGSAISGSSFTTDDGTGASHITISGVAPINEISFIPPTSFGSFTAPAGIQVLDTGSLALQSVKGSSALDGTTLLLRTNGIDLDAGTNGFQGIGIGAPAGDIDVVGQAVTLQSTVGRITLNPQDQVRVTGFFRVNGAGRITNSLTVNGGPLINDGNTILDGFLTVDDFVRMRDELQVDGFVDFRGNIDFRSFTNDAGSTARFRYNGAGQSIGGGPEPTIEPSSATFGYIGTSTRRMFRMFSSAYLGTSEAALKGEVVNADVNYCYDALRSLQLYEYSLNKERDSYYGAKGRWFLGEIDEFADCGGPPRRLGVMAAEAPDQISDEEHRNIDLYSYSSLIAGAVKALQERVEALEERRA